MKLGNKLAAEFVGTFWLVFGGCGAAVLAAMVQTQFPEGRNMFGIGYFFNIGIGYLGVALAFGLTLLTMVYAIGHISGCHLNPAVTIGLCVGRRFPAKDVVPYIVAQVLGAVAASGMLYLILTGRENFSDIGGFATNGYDSHSPGRFSMMSALASEITLTFFFLFIILGATDSRAPAGFAGIAIGLGLTLIHLVGIPVTNLSVNPARSTGPAVFVAGLTPEGGGMWAVHQLWLFWVAPIAGGIIAGVVYPLIAWTGEEKKAL